MHATRLAYSALALCWLGHPPTAGAAGVTPPRPPALDCKVPASPEAVAICKDAMLLRFYRLNQETEVDAGRRHPADTLASTQRQRAAMSDCGYDRECLRKALTSHAEELTLMLSR